MTFFDRAKLRTRAASPHSHIIPFPFTEVKNNLKDSESPRPRTTIGVGTGGKGYVSPKAEL
jgi:hypothetical protein